LGYVQFCHDVEGYDEKLVDEVMNTKLDYNGKSYENAKAKAKKKGKDYK